MDAEVSVATANSDYPEIHHWAEPVFKIEGK